MIDVVATAAIGPLGEGDDFNIGPMHAPARACVAIDPRLVAAGLRRPFAARSVRAEAARLAGHDAATALLLAAVEPLLARLEPGERVGLAVGTSSGAMGTSEHFFATLAAGGAIDATLAAGATYHAPFRALLAELASRGIVPVRTTHPLAACAASTLAIGIGTCWLEQGHCDAVLAGGYDALTIFVAAGFEALGATTGRLPPRPFRKDRDGMALGEGAGMMLLRRRSALRVARVAGFGASCDAVHLTAPDRTGGGLARAARQALLADRPVDLVSVHGTSTPFNDPMEAKAIAAVLEGRPAVHAAKATIGHTLGAAGVLESVLAIDALRRGVLPATAGDGPLDPEAGPSAPCDHNTPAEVRGVLKLSAAFGGVNAALHLLAADAPDAAPGPLCVPRRVAEVDPTPLDLGALSIATGIPRERLARMDGMTRAALTAVAALATKVGRAELVGAGIVVGTVLATLDFNATYDERIRVRGAASAEGRKFAYTTPNAAAGECAMAYQLTGPALTVSRGDRPLDEAREWAKDLIATGRATRMLTVVAEAEGACRELVLARTGWVLDGPKAELWGL